MLTNLWIGFRFRFVHRKRMLYRDSTFVSSEAEMRYKKWHWHFSGVWTQFHQKENKIETVCNPLLRLLMLHHHHSSQSLLNNLCRLQNAIDINYKVFPVCQFVSCCSYSRKHLRINHQWQQQLCKISDLNLIFFLKNLQYFSSLSANTKKNGFKVVDSQWRIVDVASWFKTFKARKNVKWEREKNHHCSNNITRSSAHMSTSSTNQVSKRVVGIARDLNNSWRWEREETFKNSDE
jgi:hypothetical protein